MTKLVRVRWNDAHAGGHEQYDVSSVPHAPLVIETFGWLLRDDPTGVSVASEYLPETSNYRSYTFIPRGMVVEVTDIAPKARRAAHKKPVAGNDARV